MRTLEGTYIKGGTTYNYKAQVPDAAVFIHSKQLKKINKNDFHREELDKGKIQHLDFKWFTEEELKNEVDFRPKFLPEHLDCEQPLINITRD